MVTGKVNEFWMLVQSNSLHPGRKLKLDWVLALMNVAFHLSEFPSVSYTSRRIEGSDCLWHVKIMSSPSSNNHALQPCSSPPYNQENVNEIWNLPVNFCIKFVRVSQTNITVILQTVHQVAPVMVLSRLTTNFANGIWWKYVIYLIMAL